MSNPSDLNIVTQPDTDKNYFNFKAAGLKIDKNYAIKFQWVYEDGAVSEWSAGYVLRTSNETAPAVPSGVTVPSTSTGSIPVELSVYPANAKRVDVYVTGGIFGLGKVAYSFTSIGKTTIAAPAGEYIVQLRSVSPSGVTSTVGQSFTINIADIGETIQEPTNPNGFSVDRILSGIQVNWNGTYANGTFTGFEAIKIYVGTSATATSGTYREAGLMTGNNLKNSITVPVDGTYLRYDLPVYIHAAAVNKSGTVGTIQANVASNSLGARSAVSSDLADEIITSAKLVADSVTSTKIALGAITEVKIDTGAITAAKIAAGAVTETKIADDAISSPKIIAGAISAGKIAAGAVTAEKIDALAISADKIQANAITSDKIIANAITAGKIDALAITSEKIAADAIVASKIKAGEIGVLKLAAGTISVNNLEAGTISSTSYLRAGSKNLTTGLGARVEISSAAIEDGTVDIAAGFYIYNSSGTAVLSAPLNGGLSIVGSGTFTGNITGASGTFGGSLSVGQAVVASITGASGNGTKVTYNSVNTLLVGDVVTISGIADNGPFLVPGSDPAQYYYTSNAYNMANVTVTDVTDTTFRVLSGVTNGSTQSYTSGGSVTGVAFRVSSTGVIKSYAGNIGGWTLNSQAFKSSAVIYPSIQLDPVSARVELRGSPGNSDTGNYIKMDPTSGIRVGSGGSPAFSVAMDGSMTATNATIQKSTGSGVIVLDSTSLRAIGTSGSTTSLGYDGSIRSYENSSSEFNFATSAVVQVATNVSSAYLTPGGISFTKQAGLYGTKAGDFTIQLEGNSVKFASTGVSSVFWGYYGTGVYTTYDIDAADSFVWKSSQIGNTWQAGGFGGFRPLGVDPFGQQVLGPRMFTGSATTNATINTDIDTNYSPKTRVNGDLYFSTA
jgi:hypothetical protein